jgi:hypothetical protein
MAPAASEPAVARSCTTNAVSEPHLPSDGGKAAAKPAVADDSIADAPRATTAAGGIAPPSGAKFASQQLPGEQGGRVAQGDRSAASGRDGGSSAVSAAPAGALGPDAEPVSSTRQAADAASQAAVKAASQGPEQLAEAFGAKLHVGSNSDESNGRAAAGGQGFAFSFKASPNPFSAPARARVAAAQKPAWVPPQAPAPMIPTWFQERTTINGVFSSRRHTSLGVLRGLRQRLRRVERPALPRSAQRAQSPPTRVSAARVPGRQTRSSPSRAKGSSARHGGWSSRAPALRRPIMRLAPRRSPQPLRRTVRRPQPNARHGRIAALRQRRLQLPDSQPLLQMACIRETCACRTTCCGLARGRRQSGVQPPPEPRRRAAAP